MTAGLAKNAKPGVVYNQDLMRKATETADLAKKLCEVRFFLHSCIAERIALLVSLPVHFVLWHACSAGMCSVAFVCGPCWGHETKMIDRAAQDFQGEDYAGTTA